jgi:iron complex outermembrane receptor protein
MLRSSPARRAALLSLSLLALAGSLAANARAGDDDPVSAAPEFQFEKVAALEASDATASATSEPVQVDGVTVTGNRSFEEKHRLPASAASVTAEELADSNNLVNTEDALKYLPSLFVRKRYIGDTNAPIATRTTGINASARSLVYADGLLLSTLINNNNGNGSPQWFLVAPNEIEQVDVLYGPYSAAYPGNSYGAVVNITTRMPEHFEAGGKLTGSSQHFSQYGTRDDFNGYEASAAIGDKQGRFSWRLSLNHLDSESQPITYLTINQSTTAAGAALPVITGAYADRNRTGGGIQVLGAGNLNRTLQDNATLKLAYDLSNTLRAAYTLGYWQNDDDADPKGYIHDAAGNTYFGASSGQVNLGGYAYNAATIASLYSSNRTQQQHLAQALSLKTDTRGPWDWSLIATDFNYLKDQTRTSTGVFPVGQFGGAGRITDAKDTGWSTLDASGVWRPYGIDGDVFLSFGAHGDQYTLDSPTFDAIGDWKSGDEGALYSVSNGKTQTGALWVQDLWRVTQTVTATLGARYEAWRAYDGLNSNRVTSTGLQSANPQQPGVEDSGVSPKLSLGWDATANWLLTGSVGRALRFPTVGELYQNVATGTTFTKPNPYLKPEDVLSGELAAEFHTSKGKVRVTLFQEQVKDALIAQTSSIPGVALPVSFTQNVDRTRQRGVELVAEQRDVLIQGLELSGNLTYVDGHILRNDGYVPTLAGATSVGRRTPYIPLWRATLLSTYHLDERWAVSLAGRYSARQYATVDNTDTNPHTYQGFEGFFVADARVNWRVTKRWSLASGVNNLLDRRYFLFHPFEGRTAFAELKFDY